MNTRFFLSGLAALALFSGCGRHAAPPANDALPVATIRVARVENVVLPVHQPVAGTVRPQARAVVAAKIMGAVARADFSIGQRVAAGETLVVLSAGEVDARVAQAQAALAQARRDFERESALLTKGASTTEEVRSLEERRRIAEASLAEAQTMQGYAQIAAPFAGVVTNKYINAGDLATPGAPLFGIEAADAFRAEVEVPETLPAIELGTKLLVTDGLSQSEGSLAELSPAADPLSRTRLAKVGLPAGHPFRSGQFVRVLWPAGEAEIIRVPLPAVSVFGQMERVFVAEEGKARLRLVRTGARADGFVHVLSGLDAGEAVVLDAPAGLRDGQPVEVTP